MSAKRTVPPLGYDSEHPNEMELYEFIVHTKRLYEQMRKMREGTDWRGSVYKMPMYEYDIVVEALRRVGNYHANAFPMPYYEAMQILDAEAEEEGRCPHCGNFHIFKQQKESNDE